jgi:hypothetical protein
LPTSPKPQTTATLPADHDVGGAVDAVDQRVAAAVEVVELRLGDRVVDVDRREQQLAVPGELVEAGGTPVVVLLGARLVSSAPSVKRSGVPAGDRALSV